MASGLLPKSPVSSSLCDEVPSHIYSKIASRAQRIFDQQCKKTFATISANSRHSRSDLSANRKTASRRSLRNPIRWFDQAAAAAFRQSQWRRVEEWLRAESPDRRQ